MEIERKENKETPPFAEEILQLFHQKCPNLSVTYVYEQNAIIFWPKNEITEDNKEIIDRAKQAEIDFESIEPIFDELRRGDKLSEVRWIAPELDIPRAIILDSCYMLRAPNCESVYVLSSAQYKNLEGLRLKCTNEDIENLLRDYFQQHALTEEDLFASQVLLGEYRMIAPVLGGIKPAAVLDTGKDRAFLERLSVESADIKLLIVNRSNSFKDDYQEFIIYNPKAVEEIFQENLDIFIAAGLSENMNAQELLEALFATNNPLLLQAPIELQRAVGIVLGFDRWSVISFNPQKTIASKNFQNIWGVNYNIADDQHEDFKKNQKRYHDLIARIKNLLKKGLPPFEILKRLSDIDSIQELTSMYEKKLTSHLNSPQNP